MARCIKLWFEFQAINQMLCCSLQYFKNIFCGVKIALWQCDSVILITLSVCFSYYCMYCGIFSRYTVNVFRLLSSPLCFSDGIVLNFYASSAVWMSVLRRYWSRLAVVINLPPACTFDDFIHDYSLARSTNIF